MIRQLPLVVLLALAACGKPAEPQPTAPVAAATEATLPADAADARPVWTASEIGVGPITATTPYDQTALGKLFPGATVAPGTGRWEDMDFPILTVAAPDGLRLEVQPSKVKDRIDGVRVLGGPVVGPRGEALGDGWTTTGFHRADCAMGFENDTGKLLCRRQGQPRLFYVFETAEPDGGNDSDIPSDALLASGAVLRQLRWFPL